jgi:hypothetical protein
MIKNIGHTGLTTHQKNGEESKIEERQSERERERGRVLLQTNDDVSHKFDHWSKNL